MKDKNGKGIKRYDLVGWSEENAPTLADGCAGQGVVMDYDDVSVMIEIGEHRFMLYPKETEKIEIRSRPVWLTGYENDLICDKLEPELEPDGDYEIQLLALSKRVNNGRL